MPVVSKEIIINFPFAGNGAIAKRSSTVTPRHEDVPVGDINPHVRMLPTSIRGCEFGSVVNPRESGIVMASNGRYEIIPPIVWEETYQYTVVFPWKAEEKGSFDWQIKHPTQELSFVFLADGDRKFPMIWQARMMSANPNGQISQVPVEYADGRVEVNLQRPFIDQILQINWERG